MNLSQFGEGDDSSNAFFHDPERVVKTGVAEHSSGFHACVMIKSRQGLDWSALVRNWAPERYVLSVLRGCYEILELSSCELAMACRVGRENRTPLVNYTLL